MLGFRSLSFALLALALLADPISADDSSDCRVPADPDTLGLGVRLGLYFQILSNLLLQLVRVDEAVDTFLPTGFFFTSFFIAVVFSTARGDFGPGAFIASTWYPVLILLSLFSFDVRGLKDGEKNRRYGLAIVVWLASGVLNIWFWFKGLDIAHADQCMDPRVFFFANLDAKGGVRVLFRILTLLFVIGLATVFIMGMMEPDPKRPKAADEESAESVRGEVSESGEVVTTIGRTPTAKSGPESESSSRAAELERQAALDERNLGPVPIDFVVPKALSANPTSPPFAQDSGMAVPTSVEIESISPTPTTPASKARIPQNPHTSTLVSPDTSTSPGRASPGEKSKRAEGPDKEDWDSALGALIFLVLYILVTELQMRWNHLDGINSVNTTGQIIPLALGSLSLFRSIYLLKDANWSRLTKEKVEEGIKKLESKLTMESVEERPSAEQKLSS